MTSPTSPSSLRRLSARLQDRRVQEEAAAAEASDAASTLAEDAARLAKVASDEAEVIRLAEADALLAASLAAEAAEASALHEAAKRKAESDDFAQRVLEAVEKLSASRAAAVAAPTQPLPPLAPPSPLPSSPQLDLPGIAKARQSGALSSTEAIEQLVNLATFASPEDLTRIKLLLDTYQTELRDAASAPQAVAPEHGILSGGDVTTAYRKAISLTHRILHLTHTNLKTAVQFDLSTGAHYADIPNTKAMTNPHVFFYTLVLFACDAISANLLSVDDVKELQLFAVERLYTGSKTEAVDHTLRRLFDELDGDVTGQSLADIIRLKADYFLHSESSRLFPKSSASPSGPKQNSRSGGGSTQTAAKAKRSDAFCWNWARGLPCSTASLNKDGVCKFSHICGNELDSGKTCKGEHRQADCPHRH